MAPSDQTTGPDLGHQAESRTGPMASAQNPSLRWFSSARGRSALLLAALAAAVIAALLQGAARRNRPAVAAAEPPSAPDAGDPGFRAGLEKTPLSYVSDYWRQLGDTVRPRLLLIGPDKAPALVVAPALAVAAIGRADASSGAAPATASSTSSPRLLAADAELGLALFELSPAMEERAFRPADPSSLHAGMQVAAISLDERERLEVMPGHLTSWAGPPTAGEARASGDPLDVSVSLTPSTRAAAIVDLDGNLVGAAFRTGRGTRLLSVESLQRAVERLRARPVCRSIETADIDQALRRIMGVEAGVAVEKVVREAFRPEPSVRAGDLLVEWNGHGLASAAAFEALYDAERPGALVPYVLRRGGRTLRGRTVVPGPDCRPPAEQPVVLATTGLTLTWDPGVADGQPAPPSWRVASVGPGSPAQGSGIRAGDRILSTNGSRPDREEPLRALGVFEATGRPVVLTLQRGERVKLLALRREGAS